MRDYVDICAVPYDEDCCEAGDPFGRIEATIFADQLIRTFGDKMPEKCKIAVKSNPHDFGTYYEAVVYYDDTCEESTDFAFMLEGGAPSHWDEIAKGKLEAARKRHLAE